MASFLPSEISRLVLGYLEEVNCMTAYDEFLKNCPNLQECRGRHFDTRVMGNTLLNILRDYSKAESEMYYNKNKELQRVLRQRWSLVQRMRFLVDNVDMAKVRQCSSNNSPFPFNTPRRSDDRKPKLCPQCKSSEACSCSRGGVVSPALSDFFPEPVNIEPVQTAPGSISIPSLVEATPLSDLPGTSVQDKEEVITSSISRCSKSKDARLSHDSGVTTVSQKSLDTLSHSGTCHLVQDKEVNVHNSEHNMSIDSSIKENVLLECGVHLHNCNMDELKPGNSCKDSNLPGQAPTRGKDNSFHEFLSGVAAHYENETLEVIGESSTPDPTLQGRLSTCAAIPKLPSELITSQITKEPTVEKKMIKTLLPKNISFPPSCEQENHYKEQMQAKPPDAISRSRIYETKANTMSEHDTNNDDIITLYGTDAKEYTTIQTIDISSFYHQTNTDSNLKNTHQKQIFQPKPAQNEQKVIILSNEIVETKTISCNKDGPVDTLQDTNHALRQADKKTGVHYRSVSDSSCTNTSAVVHPNNRAIVNMKGNTNSVFQQSSNAIVNTPDNVVSQRLRAQICSTQSSEGGKGTVLAGKLPELIITNGQVQLGGKGKILEEPKYYSEREIMSMPTLIMLHSQPGGADNESHYNVPSTSSMSFLAQELPLLHTNQDGKPQTTSASRTQHTHIPTQPVQTKPNLSTHTKAVVQTKTETQTRSETQNETETETQAVSETQPETECGDVHVDKCVTEVATPRTNTDIKKSSSTPRRQNSHIRVLDFNTPSREICSETKARTLPKNLQATPISASRTKRRAKSNLFAIKEFGGEKSEADSTQNNPQATEEQPKHVDAQRVTSQATEKNSVKINVTSFERNGPVLKSQAFEKNTNHVQNSKEIGVDDNVMHVPGLKEWQAIRRKGAGWDADLRAAAANDASVVISPPHKRQIKRKIKPKNQTSAETEIQHPNTDSRELDTSLEKNAHLLELAITADTKAKRKRPTAPRKRNPPKKKKGQNVENIDSKQNEERCENQNPLPQPDITQIRNIIENPTKQNNKTSVQDTTSGKTYLNEDAATTVPLHNHCIINDMSSITTVPGAKEALDKKIISINVGHYVNEKFTQENNNPNIPSTKNLEIKPGNFLQKDNTEKVANVSSDKDNVESPLLPYDIISPDGHFLIPSSAMRNLSSLLETPLKMALDMPMMTPRFISPGSLIDPLSVLKHLEIPTPNFSNTPKANLHCKGATPSSYASRPTDYSSGSSYYKPDDNEYRIDVAPDDDISRNSNQEGFVLPNPEINEQNNQFDNNTSKDGTVTENKSSSKNQYLMKSMEISLEKMEAENNATPEQRSTRPRRTCTLKNLPRPKSPPVEKTTKKTPATKKTTNTLAPYSDHEDSSCSDSSCSSGSSSSSSEDSLNTSFVDPRIPIVKSSTPKEMENCKVQLTDVLQNSSDDHITLTPQSKGKMSLQERLARSLEEKRKRIIKKMSESQRVSPKKRPARPRVRKPPANKKKSVPKKILAKPNVNPCTRRDSTKPVAMPRTVSQGKKATNIGKESNQLTVAHKVPCLGKSRRKSSTPRKLQSLGLDTESESHSSLSTTSPPDDGRTNVAQKDSTGTVLTQVSSSNSKQPSDSKQPGDSKQPANSKQPDIKRDIGEKSSEIPKSSVRRDDSVDDITQIKDYIAESAKCHTLTPRSDRPQGDHYESAKRIESDLLDPTSEMKEMQSLNGESFCVSGENEVAKKVEENVVEKQGCEEVERKQNIADQPEEDSSDEEDVVEWTNADSGPGKYNYISMSYSGAPPTNQFPKNSQFDPDTFCVSVSVTFAETGTQHVRKMKVSPAVTIVNIPPSKTKSETSKHRPTSKTKSKKTSEKSNSPTSKTKKKTSEKSTSRTSKTKNNKTSEKSKKKEKVVETDVPIQMNVSTSIPNCVISSTTKNLEGLEKLPDSNNVVSQMETLLAVQSIVQMDTLYTPDKSRTQLSAHNPQTVTKSISLSDRLNHQPPSDDQMCESVRKELERRKRRQIMKDIGLTDSSGGESSDSEDARRAAPLATAEPGSCRKRKRPSVAHHEDPPDKKSKPNSSKLDPHTYLKTMGIESVLSRLHGPSN